ncbi:MAG: hypothetical protein B6D35_14360 [Candidatus Brocadia sp. UTAMX2]|jgi:hypothetical protein|nr:MAG: hypothetical protein B6D35_14360 [Candidatus Brocadia sp. UTAMX2]
MAAIIMQTDFGRGGGSPLEITGVQDKRNLAYLLYELSVLPGIRDMEARLEQIHEKRTRIMQRHKNLKKEDQAKLLSADRVKNELKKVFERIKAEYKGKTEFYKQRMDAGKWLPDEQDALYYFKYWLRKYAGSMMASEKG